jgi:hypothetical protein
MDATAATKKKRAPRKATATVAAAPESSVVSAMGGPALFVEEIESAAAVAAPLPPPPAPKKKSGSRKPPVIAAVTPDGIQGSLSGMSEMRPLIAHMPIHLSDINNDLFASEPVEASVAEGQPPKPFDPEDVFTAYNTKAGTLEPPVAQTATAPQKQVVEAVETVRPSLPLHYSEKLMVRFQDANRDQRMPDSTDVACFWDCQPFRGQPCVIPTVIEEGIWRVYGNFCCPECAAAYLFHERLDSHVQWERYALLNRLYAQGESSVRLAPPRTILRLFGGNLEVSDYRAIVSDGRMRVDVMTPPMISIIQVMDTKPIDFYDASMKNTFIPWEMDRMNRPGAQGLRLRRTKPVAEKEATLEFCMGITA